MGFHKYYAEDISWFIIIKALHIVLTMNCPTLMEVRTMHQS
jgi:hypothetical protein